MSKYFKKVCAIHDLSCYGRCSLTVIIPTLSSYGIQCVPVPTALLSTHTGGFTDLFFEDLTDRMVKIGDHLKSLDIEFDAIYTGFLGSVKQIATVIDIAKSFKTDKSILLVDPVMGDDGKLYSTYNDELVEGIKLLSSHADIITPNLTEACLLTDTPYRDMIQMCEDEAVEFSLELLDSLAKKYPSASIVLTGILTNNRMITLGKSGTDAPVIHKEEHLHISFPGTGDLFASLFLSELLSGADFASSVKHAAHLTTVAVKMSQNTDEPIRNGVLLEKFLVQTDFN